MQPGMIGSSGMLVLVGVGEFVAHAMSAMRRRGGSSSAYPAGAIA